MGIGYPVLLVDDTVQGEIKVRQEIFMDIQSQENKENFGKLKWHVPVTWITSESSQTRLRMMDQKEEEMIISVPQTSTWVKLNVGQFGFYRVHYPVKTWHHFSTLLDTDYTIFSPADRASLLSDAFAMAEFGRLSYSVPMNMAQYIRDEPHIVPLKTALGKLSVIGGYLEDTSYARAFRIYLAEFLTEIYSRYGWVDQGIHNERKTRSYILNLACYNQNQQCREKAGSLFTSWVGNGSFYIPPNLRSTVYKYGMAEVGTAESWEIMFQRYLEETNAEEKARLLAGLARIENENVLRKFLKIATDGKTIYEENLDLVDGLRVLTKIGSHFYPGRVKAIDSPFIFAVSVDGERGNKPHIYPAEELLEKTILEVRPVSRRYTPVGTRVCVLWSSKLNFLYPGTVKSFSSVDKYIIVTLDDGDEREVHIDNVKLLPKGYPKVIGGSKESPIGLVESSTMSRLSVSAIHVDKTQTLSNSDSGVYDFEETDNAKPKIKSTNHVKFKQGKYGAVGNKLVAKSKTLAESKSKRDKKKTEYQKKLFEQR